MTQREISARFYAGLLDLFRRRVSLILNAERTRGPVYDPQYDHAVTHADQVYREYRDYTEPGGGRTCSKCRRIVRYDVRVCPSCGTIGGAR